MVGGPAVAGPPFDNGDVIAPIPGVWGAQAYLYHGAEGLAIIDKALDIADQAVA